MKAAPGVVLALLAVAAAGCGGSVSVQGGPRPLPPQSQLLAAEVQVVAYPHGVVRICGNQTSDLMFGPPACPFGPRAVGVRVDALRGRSSKPAERWGDLYLVGIYSRGTFRVVSQRLHGPPIPGAPFLDTPPCRAPAGGWRLVAPTDSQRATIGDYQRRHRGDLVSVAFFHDDTILTVASTHPRRTRALLGSAWPKQLCVVRTRYSRPFVNHVRSRVLRLLQRGSRSARYGWINGAGGYGVNDRGQTTISLDVLLETPRLDAFLRSLPTGLVAVDPTFKPVPRL